MLVKAIIEILKLKFFQKIMCSTTKIGEIAQKPGEFKEYHKSKILNQMLTIKILRQVIVIR